MDQDMNKPAAPQSERNEFEVAAEGESGNLFTELWGFLSHTKKWWLTPIIVVLILIGVLLIAGQGAAAPFIYTLF